MYKSKYITSLSDLEKIVLGYQIRRISNRMVMEHYRGQGRPEYKLIPGIARNIKCHKDVEEKEKIIFKSFFSELQKKGIKDIIRQDSFLTDEENIWNTLIQAQHLRIPTRLLDWSLKPLVGLWFAVEDSKNDNVDGQLWVFTTPDCIHLTDTRDNFYKKDINNLDKTYLINPPIYFSEELVNQIAEIKRERQIGKFTISSFENSIIPLEEQPKINPYLEKYIIPAEFKKQIREDLKAKGIGEEWINYKDGNKDILDKLDEIIT